MARDSRTVLTRAAPAPDLTVSYGAHRDQVADVWFPRHRTTPRLARPALVLFVHGGFWRYAYDRAHTGPLASALADLGYPVASLEYRRTGAPDGLGGWPATLDDVAAAVRHVPRLVAAALAAEGAVPPTRLVLAGHSAGGHLALWAAAGLARNGVDAGAGPAGVGPVDAGPRLVGVVALAPVADLRLAYELNLDGGAVAALIGGDPNALPDRYALADPLSLLPMLARIRVLHGGRDVQVPPELSRRFVAAARAAGDDAHLEELPAADHFDVIDPESPVWPSVVRTFHSLADG